MQSTDVTMATRTTKTPGKTGSKTTARKLTKPVLVHSDTPVDAAAPEAGEAATKVKAGAGLRLKDLIERVTTATGGKRKDVKEVVEATLTAMGEALERGESLHLPAFGKARVAKSPEGGAMTVKLRRGEGAKGGKGKAKAAEEPAEEALADSGDQG